MNTTHNNTGRISRTMPIILCLISVILCLAYAFTRPNLPTWWKQVGGGVPYVMFWITLWFAVLPRRRYIWPICAGVALFTTLLEFMQVWNPEPLASFRRTSFGAALLGQQFSWADIPPYFIGAVAGFILLHLLFLPERERVG